MAVSRAFVRQARSLLNQSSKATRGIIRTRSWQLIQRRTYASGGDHSHAEFGSDLPWATGAILFTVPSVWYLWPPPKGSHGKHGHDEHKGHGEHKGHEDGKTPENEGGDSSTEGEDAGEQGLAEQEEKDVKSDESDSENEGEGNTSPDTLETSDNESDHDPQEKEGGNEGEEDGEGVQSQGPTKKGTDDINTRKSIPDSKGVKKKRVESNYGKRQGVTEEDDATVEEDDQIQDKAAASKPAGGINTQSGKQEGISNTDTKHSTDITNDPGKSTKGEGTPETSKSKGTVDPNRPQV